MANMMSLFPTVFQPYNWEYRRVSHNLSLIFAARRYACVVYAIVVCPSVHHTPVLYQNG